MASVLIVDDLPAVHEMLEAVINPCGFLSAFALTGEEAIKRYREGNIDVVLVDINMEPMDGITVLKELKAIDPNAVVIMMTGYSSTETAMQALKYGAFDYVQKPFRVEELVKTLHRAVDSNRMEAALPTEGSETAAEEEKRLDFDVAGALLGTSDAIKKVKSHVSKVLEAKANSPVLIQGEPGTGKRAVADLIHKEGSGEDAPFQGIDCEMANPVDLKAQLIKSDGSPGTLIESVKGGTLYLNNVEALPVDVQEVLARVMQVTERNFRLICSTTINLEGNLVKGKLSEDFYFRLASLPLTLPPLRERREDIFVLVEDVLSKTHNATFDTGQMEFARDAEAILNEYVWPGNITELSNVLSQLVSSKSDRVVTAADLPETMKALGQWPSLEEFLNKKQEVYVERVLQATNNDKERSAEIAGVADIDDPGGFSQTEEEQGEVLTGEERDKLLQLKEQIDMAKQQLEESQAMLQEREQFLDMSENTLFEKVQAQQERETELEQMKDELDKREAALAEREASVQGG